VKPLFRPDDEEKPFIRRWNQLVKILLVESSVKHVARAAMDYANFADGSSCRPSNERLARETGYNERTVRNAWAAMRALGMADRVVRGTSYSGQADEYELAIPDGWEFLPVLGPHGRQFTCQWCGKLINPKGNCTVRADGCIYYDVAEFVFCPPPRAKEGRPGPACLDEFNLKQQSQAKSSFHKLGNDVWSYFKKARSDEW
jgi:hypothetical protein